MLVHVLASLLSTQKEKLEISAWYQVQSSSSKFKFKGIHCSRMRGSRELGNYGGISPCYIIILNINISVCDGSGKLIRRRAYYTYAACMCVIQQIETSK